MIFPIHLKTTLAREPAAEQLYCPCIYISKRDIRAAEELTAAGHKYLFHITKVVCISNTTMRVGQPRIERG